MGILEKLQNAVLILESKVKKLERDNKALTIATASLFYKNWIDSTSSQIIEEESLDKVLHSSQLEKKEDKSVLQLPQVSMTIPENVYKGENLKIYVENTSNGTSVKFVTDTESN